MPALHQTIPIRRPGSGAAVFAIVSARAGSVIAGRTLGWIPNAALATIPARKKAEPPKASASRREAWDQSARIRPRIAIAGKRAPQGWALRLIRIRGWSRIE